MQVKIKLTSALLQSAPISSNFQIPIPPCSSRRWWWIVDFKNYINFFQAVILLPKRFCFSVFVQVSLTQPVKQKKDRTAFYPFSFICTSGGTWTRKTVEVTPILSGRVYQLPLIKYSMYFLLFIFLILLSSWIASVSEENCFFDFKT